MKPCHGIQRSDCVCLRSPYSQVPLVFSGGDSNDWELLPTWSPNWHENLWRVASQRWSWSRSGKVGFLQIFTAGFTFCRYSQQDLLLIRIWCRTYFPQQGLLQDLLFIGRIYCRIYFSHQDSLQDLLFIGIHCRIYFFAWIHCRIYFLPGFTAGFTFCQDLLQDLLSTPGFTTGFTFCQDSLQDSLFTAGFTAGFTFLPWFTAGFTFHCRNHCTWK